MYKNKLMFYFKSERSQFRLEGKAEGGIVLGYPYIGKNITNV
jgi:hypothetical protein